MTYTEKELDQFLHGISLSLLSKKSAQHWRYDEETAKKIEWLEALERKVRADKADRKTEPTISKMEQVEDDAYFLKLMGAVERGEISDAGANQAWYEYINHKDEPQKIAEDINRRVEMGKKEWNARHIEDEPQTYKPTCNGECRNCEYRAKDGNYCMKTDCSWK